MGKSESAKYNWRRLSLELLVVFLGVTAGFLLNNWRMQEQKAQLEKNYLSGFLRDVNENINQLEESIRADSIWLKRALPILYSCKNNEITMDSALVLTKLSFGFQKTSINRGTYQDISSSGSLNIINNFDLRAAIVDYYLAIEGSDLIDTYYSQYFNDYILPFIFQEYDLLNNDFIRPEVIRSLRFSNLMAGYTSFIQQQNDSYKQILSQSLELRDLLKKNI